MNLKFARIARELQLHELVAKIESKINLSHIEVSEKRKIELVH